jgi:hypothetical protein
VFHISGGAGRRAVRLALRSQKGDEDVFDSRQLGANDLFALTLLRPGRYELFNLEDKSRAEVVVSYPTPSREPRGLLAPVEVAVEQGAVRPNKIAVRPAQGLVFRINTRSRLTLSLVEPDDGPGKGKDQKEPPVRSWRRRMPADAKPTRPTTATRPARPTRAPEAGGRGRPAQPPPPKGRPKAS